jgi:hypothetical protein
MHKKHVTLLAVMMVYYVLNIVFATFYLVNQISIQQFSKYYEPSSKMVIFKILTDI